jgi:hypothetical protein
VVLDDDDLRTTRTAAFAVQECEEGVSA